MAKILGPEKVQRYSVEFWLKAVKLSQLEGVQVQDVADALDIHPFMLSKWRKQAREALLKARVGVADSRRRRPIPGLGAGWRLRSRLPGLGARSVSDLVAGRQKDPSAGRRPRRRQRDVTPGRAGAVHAPRLVAV